jgi:hypothetical protein
MTETAFERKQLEFMAAACCFAEFRAGATKETPLSYWKRVSNPKAREFYLNQARAVIALVRNMPTVKP